MARPDPKMLRADWKTKYRDLWLAAIVYLFVTLTFAVCASPNLWLSHTQHNHYAWLADAFVHGRLSLDGRPPAYAAGNDFALFQNRWYVVFPPFPALLLVPFVAFTKHVDNFRDGIFFLSVAGFAPAGLLLALQSMRRLQLTLISERTALLLSGLFALGTVYFFSAVQGTVWFAAHVIATSAITLFLAASIGAQHPILAGLALCAALGTRSHLRLNRNLLCIGSLPYRAKIKFTELFQLGLAAHRPPLCAVCGVVCLCHARFVLVQLGAFS